MTRISLRSVVCVVLGMLLQIATQFLFFRKSVLWFAMGTYFASNYVVGGLAMLFRYPQLAGKNRETGQIHPLGILFWFPTRILQLLIVLFKRYGIQQDVPAISKIRKNWYLGQYPNSDAVLPKELLESDFCLIDLTCEQPKQVTKCKYYINVPTWDGHAPSLADMKQGIQTFKQIMQKEKDIGVLVHCAFGKGRSTMFLCALMVECGFFKCWQEAYAHIKQHRRIVNLGYEFTSQLERWEKLSKLHSKMFGQHFYNKLFTNINNIEMINRI